MTHRLRNSRAMRAYDRIADRLLAADRTPRKPLCRFRGGYLMVGTQSQHRTAAARRWRLFWRLKMNRMVNP